MRGTQNQENDTEDLYSLPYSLLYFQERTRDRSYPGITERTARGDTVTKLTGSSECGTFNINMDIYRHRPVYRMGGAVVVR